MSWDPLFNQPVNLPPELGGGGGGGSDAELYSPAGGSKPIGGPGRAAAQKLWSSYHGTKNGLSLTAWSIAGFAGGFSFTGFTMSALGQAVGLWGLSQLSASLLDIAVGVTAPLVIGGAIAATGGSDLAAAFTTGGLWGMLTYRAVATVAYGVQLYSEGRAALERAIQSFGFNPLYSPVAPSPAINFNEFSRLGLPFILY